MKNAKLLHGDDALYKSNHAKIIPLSSSVTLNPVIESCLLKSAVAAGPLRYYDSNNASVSTITQNKVITATIEDD
jgi:hypothetical protein